MQTRQSVQLWLVTMVTCHVTSVFVFIGMQVLLYSECEGALGREGWSRVGENMVYSHGIHSHHYTLSWSMVYLHTAHTQSSNMPYDIYIYLDLDLRFFERVFETNLD